MIGRLLSDGLSDVRLTLRTLVRSPGFAVTASILAFAIGSTTAVSRTLDWMLFRSTEGVSDPERIVVLELADRAEPEDAGRGLSYAQYEEIRAAQETFTDVATYAKLAGALATDRDADEIAMEYVSGGYFSLLGVRPALGRLLTVDDDVEGAPPVVVLSHRYWQTRFGADPNVLDRAVRLNGQPVRIVGVVDAAYDGYSTDWYGLTDVWAANQTGAAISRGMAQILNGPYSYFRLVARMRTGVTPEAVRARADEWMPELPPLRTNFEVNELRVTPGPEMRINRRAEAAGFLVPIRIVSILILLGACFGAATFLLDRALSRRYDLALRAALGATWSRLLRQTMTEAMVLGLGAGVLGLGIGAVLAELLSGFTRVYLDLPPTTASFGTEGALGAGMVLSALGLGAASAVGFGLIPALRSFRQPVAALRRLSPSWSWAKLRLSPEQGVLVLQVGLAVSLAVVAASYGRSFAEVAFADPGVEGPSSVLVARVLPAGLSGPEGVAFNAALLDGVAALPGVDGASMGSNASFSPGGPTDLSAAEGGSAVDDLWYARAAPGMLEAEGIQLMSGRDFDRADEDFANGILLNSIAARRLWGDGDPLGRVVRSEGSPDMRVIGVVSFDRCRGPDQPPTPCAWLPFRPGAGGGYLRVRAGGDPYALLPAIERVVRDLDPRVAISGPTTLAALIGDAVAPYRGLAIVSLTLALLGVFVLGVSCVSLFLSMVRGSRRELAIRMALGAAPRDVTVRVLGQGLALALAGVALGIVLVFSFGGQLTTALYAPAAPGAGTLVLAPLAVALVSLAAVAYSARTAARTEPLAHLGAG